MKIHILHHLHQWLITAELKILSIFYKVTQGEKTIKIKSTDHKYLIFGITFQDILIFFFFFPVSGRKNTITLVNGICSIYKKNPRTLHSLHENWREPWKYDNSASGGFGKLWIKKISASQMKTGEIIKGTWG